MISTAFVDENLAHPPYRAELFSALSGWSGVSNKFGINVLRFSDKPGAVVTDFDSAIQIAENFNMDAQHG